MIERLAGLCYRRRWSVVGVWIALLVGLNVVAAVGAGETSDDFNLPSSESQQALDLLAEAGFASRTGEQVQVVFSAPGGVRAPDIRATMERLFTGISTGVPGAEVVSPYGPQGGRQVSADSRIAYAEVNLPDRDEDARKNAASHIEHLRDDVRADGLRIELGGKLFAEDGGEGGVPTELIGILAAVLILLVAFGSVLAMGLPIVVGVFGAGSGVAVLGLSANLIDMPSFASAAAAMIAIGVGIDYALLVVTRYRERLHAGSDPQRAVAASLTTAGRSVLFAGVTVVIGVLGLLFMGLGLINGVAVGIAASVLMTMLASVTLLPALLGFAGRNIDRLGLPRRRRREGDPDGDRGGLAARWSLAIQRRPVRYGLAAFALLVVVALPVGSLRLGFGDAGNLPKDNTSRQAYDLLSDGFGPGFNGPLLVAARLGDAPDGAAVADRLSAALGRTEGVALASPAQLNPARNAAIIQVIPTTSPQDEATERLVHTLRDEVVPGAVAGTGVQAHVGGITAGAIDYAEYTGNRLPLFVGVVLAASFLLIMVVFRSLLVPVKAVLMNTLTVLATYGALVAVFQWGWGLSLFGIDRTGPVDAWAPMWMFAVIFGLSMDYEVFLVSRMKEEYDRTRDAASAVAEGVARTSRVITAAAAIMVCVFGSFVFGGERALAIIGFGLAFSILIDATVVRLVLVPAVMQLLGDRAWWLPGRLDALLPKLTIDAGHMPAGIAAPASEAAAVAVPTPPSTPVGEAAVPETAASSRT